MQRLTRNTRERHLAGEVKNNNLSAPFHDPNPGWEATSRRTTAGAAI
jgi:hypothetical protein